MQLCHWYLHILELHDSAKEGYLNRTLLNCKNSIPFFYSHSRLSKYLVENVDYLLKTEKLLSPLQRIRVLEGSYVNSLCGHGNNVECDLVQEHSVCNQKALIKALGANKSEKFIYRMTASADACPLCLLRAWRFYNFIHCISYMYGTALNGLEQFPFSLKV